MGMIGARAERLLDLVPLWLAITVQLMALSGRACLAFSKPAGSVGPAEPLGPSSDQTFPSSDSSLTFSIVDSNADDELTESCSTPELADTSPISVSNENRNAHIVPAEHILRPHIQIGGTISVVPITNPSQRPIDGVVTAEDGDGRCYTMQKSLTCAGPSL